MQSHITTQQLRLQFIFAVVLVLVSSCASVPERTCTSSTFSVRITKGICFGRCPAWEATIRGDRSVHFRPILHIEPPIEKFGTIDDATLCAIADAIDSTKAFETEFSYEMIPDAPKTAITIEKDGRSTTVTWYIAPPESMRKLHDLLVAATYDRRDTDLHASSSEQR